MYKGNDQRRNSSGCMDMTAYEAIKNIEAERRKKLLDTIFYICHLAGYSVEGRIVLKDKKTGEVWR